MKRVENRKQFLRFAFFSGTAAALQFGTFALLNEVIQLPYYLSYGTSLVVMVLFNTTFNRKFTFRSTIKYRTVIYKLGLFYLFFLPIASWGGNQLVEYGWQEYLVLIISMIINLILAFYYNRHFIYRDQINTIE